MLRDPWYISPLDEEIKKKRGSRFVLARTHLGFNDIPSSAVSRRRSRTHGRPPEEDNEHRGKTSARLLSIFTYGTEGERERARERKRMSVSRRETDRDVFP